MQLLVVAASRLALEMIAVRLVLATALLFVVSPALAQSDSTRATVNRGGIKGEPIPIGSKDPTVSDYLEQVRRLIQKNWAYPCVKNAETGRCEHKAASLVVEFGILRAGALAFIEIQSSSGFAIYDQHAFEAIKLASPFPAVPSALMDRVPPQSTGVPVRANFTYKIETDLPGGLRVSPSPPVTQGASSVTTARSPILKGSGLKAGVITALEGGVTARRPGLPSPVPLKVRDDVFLQDVIASTAGARVEMLLGGKIHITLQERSVLTLTEVPRRAFLDLSTGKLAIDIDRARMRPGEAIDVRTPNVVATVLGTRMIVETLPPAEAGGAVVTHVDVVAGSVSIAIGAGTPKPAMTLQANQGLTITGEVAGPIRPLQALSVPQK
jgi:TonB family protein